MLYTILSDVMTFSEDQAAVMTLDGRKDAEQLLWAEPNKKAERENRPAFYSFISNKAYLHLLPRRQISL